MARESSIDLKRTQPEHFGTPGCAHDFDPECARCNFGRQVLDAIPDGWAKVDGEWVQLHYMEVNGMSVMGVPMEPTF